MATMRSEQQERDRQRFLATASLRPGEVRMETTKRGARRSYNPRRREKRAWMRATGKSGRQWRMFRKAMRRAGAR